MTIRCISLMQFANGLSGIERADADDSTNGTNVGFP